jgi:thiosulfate reductase cytochrome b subunit
MQGFARLEADMSKTKNPISRWFKGRKAAQSAPAVPAWLRITHWLNVVAATVMVLSGWRIYGASPIFPFHFPPGITLGGWLAGALQWHFAAMWLLFVNGLVYLALNIATGRMKTKYFPLSLKELWRDIMQTLRLSLQHNDLSRYNMIQKLSYLFAIATLVMMVLSGLVLWKSVQFPLLRALLGGYDTARVVHFVCMCFIVGFTAVHVVMALLVPRTLKGMILGRF